MSWFQTSLSSSKYWSYTLLSSSWPMSSPRWWVAIMVCMASCTLTARPSAVSSRLSLMGAPTCVVSLTGNPPYIGTSGSLVLSYSARQMSRPIDMVQ